MTITYLILVIIGVEIALTAIFWLMSRSLDLKSLIKGIIERAFLTISLQYGYPHALTVFSALKLGTRLKRDDKTEDKDIKLTSKFHFNDFYLIGNFLSVTAAVIYAELLKK